MGFIEHKHIGGTRTDFWPDDTEKEFYLPSYGEDFSLLELIDKVKAKFGDDVNLDNVVISSEYIHTEALYYDLHDPSDYTKFLRITLKE